MYKLLFIQFSTTKYCNIISYTSILCIIWFWNKYKFLPSVGKDDNDSNYKEYNGYYDSDKEGSVVWICPNDVGPFGFTKNLSGSICSNLESETI